MNKFAEWMKNNDRKQRSVAEKIGISPTTLNEIIKDKQMPSLKIAYEIELYTRGAVTLYDWLDQGEEQNKKLSKSAIQTEEKKVKK